MASSLPVFCVKGSNYEVGKATGKAFSYKIRRSLMNLTTLADILLPFYQTIEGRSVVEALLNNAKNYYPQYVSELQGIADGAGVDFIQLFLLHIETELIQNGKSLSPVSFEGCTDIYLNTAEEVILGHNEDTTPEIKDDVYILRVHILPTEENGYTEEKFTSFAYPGGIPGNSCGFNFHGLASTTNHLFQRKTSHQGIPRRFVARAVLAAKNVDEVKKILDVHPGISTGMNFNLVEIPDYKCILDQNLCRMTNIETAAVECATQTDCMDVTGFYHHFNEHMRLEGDFLRDPSSEFREKRLTELIDNKAPKDLADVKAILGDTYNAQYPMYRTGKMPDYLTTVCSVIFDVKRKVAEFYHGNPMECQPFASFSLIYQD